MIIRCILIVCQGNICRSPMAEGYFKHQLINEKITVISAGLGAVVNHPADIKAQTVMLKAGIDISNHRARQININLIMQANLILVMTFDQLMDLEKQFITAKGKTFLIGHWQGLEIDDPIMQSQTAFETVYQQISLAWQEWQSKIVSCQYQV